MCFEAQYCDDPDIEKESTSLGDSTELSTILIFEVSCCAMVVVQFGLRRHSALDGSWRVLVSLVPAICQT